MSKRVIIVIVSSLAILIVINSLTGTKAHRGVGGRSYEKYLETKKDQEASKLAYEKKILAAVQEAQRQVVLEESNIVNESKPSIAQAQDKCVGDRLKAKNRPSQVQAALKRAGFYKKGISGKFDTETRKAIKRFQKAKGLTVDGVAGKKTWAALQKYLN